jgi:hypothetical protein
LLKPGIIDMMKTNIQASLDACNLAILPPLDVRDSLQMMKVIGLHPAVTILDPWYNKGFGEVREDYDEYILELIALAGDISPHVFLWGFPEIVARFVGSLPQPLELVAWLTWYYKNNPSVIRGWRSSQNACLHLSHPGAALYPENFFNDRQKALQSQGKLRYIPGPTSVIEAPLLVGFVGRNEQTGHPAQKPVTVFERLILMTTQPGDLVFDPMCGAGTTAVAAHQNQRRAVISDHNEDYLAICETRLGIRRIPISSAADYTPQALPAAIPAESPPDFTQTELPFPGTDNLEKHEIKP